ncbi:MAG: hypothetical protein FWE11_02340 [Defluviitaleaceae bacterium]|nr:hypothetical protein [Defluviitaleaceae bacterium]
MPKMVSKREASLATGLSEWELGRGARAGEYPCIKVGVGRGKYLFDIDLLNETLTKRAMANIASPVESTSVSPYGIRKIE